MVCLNVLKSKVQSINCHKAGEDKLVGFGMLGVSAAIFTYYTCWVMFTVRISPSV